MTSKKKPRPATLKATRPSITKPMPPPEGGPAAPSAASGVQTPQQQPVAEVRPAAEQIVADAFAAYDAAKADRDARAADLNAAGERVKAASLAELEAGGAFNAAHAEFGRATQRLTKALHDQRPNQLIAHAGKVFIASGAERLSVFDAPVSL